VCEDALLKSLQDSHLAGCALDVFANEPYNLEQNEALANLDNVIMTAHMGSCTRKGRELMEVGAATSIVEFAKGIEPVNVIRSAE
jgi:D-3-phosphoglycerate dehydrogenase